MASKAKPKSPPSVEAQQSSSAGSQPTEQANGADNKRRLQELTSLVSDTANAKGWDVHIAAEDKKNFKYATVAVSRTAPNTYQEITGTFEITCDERIKITYHKTSFHDWGLADLYDAIANEFWKCLGSRKRLQAERIPPSQLLRWHCWSVFSGAFTGRSVSLNTATRTAQV
jgi:hypothetical protein